MSSFEIMDGSYGLGVSEIAHVLIPGRGRNESGSGLSTNGENRVDLAADVYICQNLADISGVLVPSGYKTPGDKNGEPWSPIDCPNETFLGVPEADAMMHRLLLRGISKKAIMVERRSVDTVTNFARAEADGHFPDDRPVAIVAQEEHLERMIRIIAPKTLRRDFLGLIVTQDPEQMDVDNIFARTVSRVELLNIRPDTKRIVEKTTRRSNAIWFIVNHLPFKP